MLRSITGALVEKQQDDTSQQLNKKPIITSPASLGCQTQDFAPKNGEPRNEKGLNNPNDKPYDDGTITLLPCKHVSKIIYLLWK